MSGKRWKEEDKQWYFDNIVEVGIPRTSNLAREMMAEKFGKAPSKATLQYWTNPGEKERLRNRTQKYRKENIKIIVTNRLSQFRRHTDPTEHQIPISEQNRGLHRVINGRISGFHAKGGDRKRNKVRMEECTFKAEDLLERMQTTQNFDPETNECVCTICGDKLNLLEDKWHMDHIDPFGGNGIDNASCVHAECNQMKAALTMEKLVELSRKVLKRHGETYV